MTEKVIRDILKYMLFAFILSSILFWLYCASKDKTGVAQTDGPVFIENWTVIDSDGNEMQAGRSYVDDRAYEEDFTIVATLPDGIKDNCFLCFPTRSDTIVYIDGSVRKEYLRLRDADIPGGSVKGFYYTVPLKESDSGAELRIFRGRTNRHPEIVPVTFVATMSGVYSYMFGEYGVTFFLALIILFMSIVVMTAGLIMRIIFRRRIDMFHAAVGTFVTAGWVVTNSYLCPFVVGHYHIDGTMNYLLCLMLPMGFLLYLDSIQKGRYTKVVTLLMIFDMISAVLWTGLHFTRILSYDRALLYIDLILALIMFSVLVILFIDLKRGHFSEYKYTAAGFFGLVLLGVIEVIVLLFVETKHDSIPMLLGLSAFLICVIIQQISDLLKMNEDKNKAMELSDAKTRFLAGMSHEIRTPINSILGMNEMIIRENKDRVIDEYAKSVRSSGKMLLTLVNDVLDFSKIEAGKLEITEADYRLSAVLTDIQPLILERADAKGLHYEMVIHDGVPNGQCSDEFRIKQVLVNLINNAIKYTDKGNVTLTVGGEYTGEDTFDLRFSIKDTGRGIRKEDQAGLFEAFTRVDMNKNRNIEGTGLGLAIVKNILDSMGGKIEFESEYGVGSDFVVTIPVKVTDKSELSISMRFGDNKAEEKHKCDYSAPSAKILAVDDNRSNLNIVRLFLGAAAIVPELCGSGREAIEKCKKTEYDLILLDHMMPTPDGIETLKIIRNDPQSRNKNTPAVTLTANAMAGSRQIYMEAGFEDYLTKPIDATLLEQTVKKYLPEDKIMPPITDDKSGANDSALMRKLSAIEGLDIKAALAYSANNEEFLAEIISTTIADAEDRALNMRRLYTEGDYDSYRMEAHTIKGQMATLGLSALSERAKRHEYAARDRDEAFMASDHDEFLKEYVDICNRLK